jgi:SAM-dependent methyltransferase
MKLNLGCGTNRLPGWLNYDAELDITKPLPFLDGTIDFIFAEHVVEHVHQREAFSFFEECHRVLKPGGMIRIAVPSADQIMRLADDDYCAFVSKWSRSKGKTKRDALDAIIINHGHRAIWSAASLAAAIYAAGFEVGIARPGKSDVPALQGLEGHGKVIGEKFNEIETVVVEGTK